MRPPLQVKEIDLPEHSIAERAYLAGLVDGEGYIGIVDGGRHRPLGRGFGIRLTITNTNFLLLEKLNEIWGGWIVSQVGLLGHKPSAKLMFSARKAAVVLKEIQPFLIAKREHCKLALRFQKTMNNHYGRVGIPQDVLAERIEMARQMKQLNKRGLDAISEGR